MTTPKIGSNKWLAQIFGANQVTKGGMVRRSIKSVKKLISEEVLKAEVEKRGFHLLIVGPQYVVLCNKGSLSVLC